MTKVNIAQFKAKLPEYIELLQRGEGLTLTNHGEEVVTLCSIQNIYRNPPDLKKLFKIVENQEAAQPGTSGEEIIRTIRDEE
jgi:antitoxin (DNA-binding transcriptional repressor) of toxin-antitoxin stability system